MLYIREKDGKLNALIEWFFEYPLERVSRDVYRFPDWGLYEGEEIVFRRDSNGRATVAVAGSVPFKRRALAGDDDRVSFRITPVKPVAELRTEALAASPPEETGDFRPTDLVELRSLDPTIAYDIRYATSNNFMGAPFYTSAHAFMQRPAAEAVVRAARRLRPLGYGLLVHDCVSAVVRDQDVLGRHAGGQAPLRRRSRRRIAAQPRLRGRPHPLRPEDREADSHDRRLRRDERPLLSALSRRHLAPAVAPRSAAPRDGGGGLHRLRGGVVALRLSGLAAVPDPEPHVRAAWFAAPSRITPKPTGERMTRFLVGLLLAALTLGRNDLAAQRPAQRPPAPSIERAGPEGPPAGAAQLTRADVQAWLDGFLPYALQRGDVPGAVVAVVKDGEVLFKKGYGYADLKRKKPVDPDRTLFRPGSVSKLFTWTAVMQLVEQGKLDLDKDVNTYLDFKIPAAFGKPITLRNAMTHTPGFEEVGRNLFSDDTTKVQPNGDWLKSWTPDADLSAGNGARVLQLRHGAGRVHRPAGVGRAVRAVHRASHLPAARHGARHLPPAAAGVTAQRHGRGL